MTFVCKRRFGYSGNIRLVCEGLAARGEHTVQVWCEAPLPRSTKDVLRQRGIRRLHWFSPLALWYLARSGVIVVDHSIRDAYIIHRRPDRAVVNLWHGVAIKNIELGMRALGPQRRRVIEATAQLYDAMIASSEQDREVVARSFGVPRQAVSITGLPRYDLLDARVELPADLLDARARLHGLLQGRRLVLYAPTFREHGRSPLDQMTAAEWQELDAAVGSMGAVLGLRSHPYDRAEHPRGFANIVSLAAADFPEANLLLRDAAVLVTDYSSIWVDFLLLKRPVVGFGKDRQGYVSRERGFIYPFDEVFPGPFCETVPELASALQGALEQSVPVDYRAQRELLHSEVSPPYTDHCLELILGVARSRAQEASSASG